MAVIGVVSLALATSGYLAFNHQHARAAAPFHNPLLNVTADQGDINDFLPPSAPPALCASYTTNPYNNPAPNVDVISGDTTVTVGTQTGCKAAQNETTIAVNPHNGKNLVAGSNDYRVFNTREHRNDGSGYAYTTFDGGKTWANIQLPHLTYQTGATGTLSDMDSAGDPAISFGPNNTVYYANLVFSRFNSGSGVVVSVSHDGGLTWSEPSIVHTDGVDSAGKPLPTPIFNDKEWIGADPGDSKTAYVSWTMFQPSGSPIVVSATHDGGQTWSAPTTVNPTFTAGGITPYSQGSIPQVGEDGQLYIAYESAVCQSLNCDQATDYDAVIMAKSHDGGQHFANTVVSLDFDFPLNPHVGRSTLTGENFRINSFPQFTLDSDNGTLWVTWADDRNGQYDANGNSVKTNGDVFVASSHDGTHWSKVTQLGTSADEVYPAIAANDGNVAVTTYTRAYNPTGINLDYAAFTFSSDDGHVGAVKQKRITTQSANPQIQFVGADAAVPGAFLQGVFIGDYTAVAMASDGTYYPCWTDFRGNPGVNNPNQDVYVQAVASHDN